MGPLSRLSSSSLIQDNALTKTVLRAWKYYLRKLNEKPVVTTTLSTGFLFTTGDILAQNLVERRYTNAPWDVSRTLRVGAVGLLFMGPSYALWYRGLDRFISGTGVKQILTKVLIDQGFMAWVFCAWFVTANACLAGQSLPDAWAEWGTHWRDIMEANYKLWPAAQLLNFSVIPSTHRVLFVNLVSIGWNTFLAWSSHRKPEGMRSKDSVESVCPSVSNPPSLVCKASAKEP